MNVGDRDVSRRAQRLNAGATTRAAAGTEGADKRDESISVPLVRVRVIDRRPAPLSSASSCQVSRLPEVQHRVKVKRSCDGR